MLSLFGQNSSCCSSAQNSYRNYVNDPPNLVRCTYGVSPGSQNCGGLQATTIACQRCARHEVRVNACPPPQDDPCFTRIPKNSSGCQDHGDSCCGSDTKYNESCSSRRKNYAPSRKRNNRSRCMPYTGPLSEYQDAYRKRNPRAGPRLYHRPYGNGEECARPAWNSSITVPSKPYQETLDAAEAKLRALDVFEDPTPDVMALAIIRDQIRERYRVKRSGGYGGECCEEEDNVVLMNRSANNYAPSKTTYISYKPTAVVKATNLELVEEESLASCP